MNAEESEMCVVAICKDCEHVRFIAVNNPRVMDAEMLREIGEMAMRGNKIDHWPVLKVRQCKTFGCKCI